LIYVRDERELRERLRQAPAYEIDGVRI
jgi:hypothetical protein